MARSPWKLVACLAALVVLVVAVVGLQARREFSARALEVRRLELETALPDLRAALARFALETASMAELDAAIRPFADASGARVTLIRRDGTVVSDSALPPGQVDRFANHADRPEIAAALSDGRGSAVRRSASVGRELLYVAVPTRSGDGVIRLAVPLGEDRSALALDRWLLQALAVGLLAALGLGWVLARSNARAVAHMGQVAIRVAEGDFSQRVRRHAGDDLDPIAGAIDRMAEQLRLQLEEATQEKERLGAVLNGMVEAVIVVDLHGKIVLVNDRAQEFFSISERVVGRPFLEVLRNATLDDLLAEAARRDEPATGEVQIAMPVERVLRVQAVRYPRGASRPLGTVAAFHDVTDIVRLEQVRRDFVANASHELRTPLAAIGGFAETLLSNRNLGEDDQRRYLEVIDRHAERLTHLVADLLELSKVESRAVEPELAEIDVAELAGTLIEDLQGAIAEKDLVASVERRGHPVARADQGAVQQILVNLVDNAIKYTEPGGEIQVRVEEAGGYVSVEVTDDGIGVPADDRERIFERFYRVDKARSRDLGGTGLGLAIVKHLVQGQGGTIQMESEVGRGSTFRFTLPRAEGPSPERTSDGTSPT